MPVSTWIAYQDFGDGIVFVLAESDRATQKYGSFQRAVKRLVGHTNFEIISRVKALRDYPEAMADYDRTHPNPARQN